MKGRRPKTQNQAQFYQEIGGNIRDMRAWIGLTQEEVARAVGISRPSLANIEKGNQEIRLHLAVLLAEVFQCQLADLLSKSPWW